MSQKSQTEWLEKPGLRPGSINLTPGPWDQERQLLFKKKKKEKEEEEGEGSIKEIVLFPSRLSVSIKFTT